MAAGNTKFYHKTFQNELMADMGFMALSAQAAGVYFHLRLMAANTNNSGSIRVGKARMDQKMLTNWIVDQFKCTRAEARKIIKELEQSEHVVFGRTGAVKLQKYVEEQLKATSPSAAKKAAQRAAAEERKRIEMLGLSDDPGGVASLAPAQSQFSVQKGGDMSPDKRGDMSPHTEQILKKDTSVSLNTDAETEELAAKGEHRAYRAVSEPFGPGAGASEATPDGVIRRACRLTREFDVRAVNVYRARLKDLQNRCGDAVGLDLFRHAMDVLEGEVKRGVKFHRGPSAYLQGVIRKLMEGGNP